VLAVVAVAAAMWARHRHNVRLRRNVDLASLGLKVGTTYASTAARKVFASAERRIELDAERELKTAEAISERLGNMKGALMKLGQMASYVDEGLPGPCAKPWPSCSRTPRR
jgi:predicted unusual protein kinase regulating ubiquinone biosynthesis (AarF/ABC1/UbiB family)